MEVLEGGLDLQGGGGGGGGCIQMIHMRMYGGRKLNAMGDVGYWDGFPRTILFPEGQKSLLKYPFPPTHLERLCLGPGGQPLVVQGKFLCEGGEFGCEVAQGGGGDSRWNDMIGE